MCRSSQVLTRSSTPPRDSFISQQCHQPRRSSTWPRCNSSLTVRAQTRVSLLTLEQQTTRSSARREISRIYWDIRSRNSSGCRLCHCIQCDLADLAVETSTDFVLQPDLSTAYSLVLEQRAHEHNDLNRVRIFARSSSLDTLTEETDLALSLRRIMAKLPGLHALARACTSIASTRPCSNTTACCLASFQVRINSYLS